MAKKDTDYGLTLRFIQSERSRLAKSLAAIHNRMIKVGLGEVEATQVQVNAMKAIQQKLMGDITPEDLKAATGEQLTPEQLTSKLLVTLDTKCLKDLMRFKPTETIALFTQLGELMPAYAIGAFKDRLKLRVEPDSERKTA